MAEFEPLDDNTTPWVIAGFHGECSLDGCDIEEGDEIRADNEGGWEKRECVESEFYVDEPPAMWERSDFE